MKTTGAFTSQFHDTEYEVDAFDREEYETLPPILLTVRGGALRLHDYLSIEGAESLATALQLAAALARENRGQRSSSAPVQAAKSEPTAYPCEDQAAEGEVPTVEPGPKAKAAYAEWLSRQPGASPYPEN